LAFGARVGAILFGFPAIVAASLTLIEAEEDAKQAREDGRGAIVGAGALTVFAVVAVLLFGHLAGGIVLVLGATVWSLTALSVYVRLWWR
ncbi:MAG TPA: hypothetical protein VMF57_21405, partial [Solirubrobacteraceae bacterium]|nr:hypothetical protein [Solirubrobacteraceae bacterium]